MHSPPHRPSPPDRNACLGGQLRSNFRPQFPSTPQGLTLLFDATFRRIRPCLLALVLPSTLVRAQRLDSSRPPELNAVATHQLLALANADRARQHLPPLAWDPALARAARTHADRIAHEPTLEHQYTAEADLLHRAAVAGAHLSVVSENLLRGDAAVLEQPAAPRLIEQTWMASPIHRANLLDPRLNAAGISLVPAGNTLVVEDLARTSPDSLGTAGLEATERAVAEILLAHGISQALPTTAARAACRTPAEPGAVTPVLTIAWDGPDPTTLPAALLALLPRHPRAEIGACPGAATAQGFTTTRVTVLLP